MNMIKNRTQEDYEDVKKSKYEEVKMKRYCHALDCRSMSHTFLTP